MMSEDSRQGYHKAKQEGATIEMEKFSKLPSSSRQWPGYRNPRIVRVSRTFGGKDRHSKVCTVRGLRDRRIRLSVPTAVQLYDLQDRLGLGQPSKVIDWLLEATKYDIDKLPPLQIPHGFPQFHPQTLLPLHHHESTLSLHSSLERGSIIEKGKWVKASEEENEDRFSEVSFQKQFPSGVQYYNGMPYNYNPYHSEPASLSLSQFGSHGLVFPSQTEYANIPSSSSGNGVQFSSCLPVVVPPPSGSQLLFYPSSSAATPSFFVPHQIATSADESDPRGQFSNHVQSLSSSSSHVMPPNYPHISCLKPLPAPFSSRLLDSDRSQPHKESTR